MIYFYRVIFKLKTYIMKTNYFLACITSLFMLIGCSESSENDGEDENKEVTCEGIVCENCDWVNVTSDYDCSEELPNVLINYDNKSIDFWGFSDDCVSRNFVIDCTEVSENVWEYVNDGIKWEVTFEDQSISIELFEYYDGSWGEPFSNFDFSCQ